MVDQNENINNQTANSPDNKGAEDNNAVKDIVSQPNQNESGENVVLIEDAPEQSSQNNDQQTQYYSSPVFGIVEFIADLDELNSYIDGIFLKFKNIEAAELLNNRFENDELLSFQNNRFETAKFYTQHIESTAEYLPFWFTLLKGLPASGALANVLDNEVETSDPPVFEMSADEPEYAVLAPLTASATLGDDTITGSLTAENVIDALGGNDIVAGGNLSDQLWGGDGNDTLDGGDGDDRIFGAAGDDQITGGNGEDWIWGGDGADTLSGNDGDDFISGNAGNDTIYGNIGSDTVYGGDGDDTIYALDTDEGNKSDLTYENLIYGEEGDDILYGSSGTDTLDGGIGNDTLNSGSGSGDSFEDFVMGLNPIVYYRLGEIVGTTAVDKAGNQNATYSADVELAQSGFNNTLSNTAVSFDGRDEQVVTALDNARFDTTQGTVSAWFNVANTAGDYAVFSKDGNGDVDGQFYVGVNSNGDIYGRVQQDGGSNNFTYDPTAIIGGKVQAGQWYLLTMTYGAGGADFYINGEFLGNQGRLTQTNSDRDFLIGGQNAFADVRDEFQGSIDDVFWLPDQLDAAGVNSIYTAGTGATADAQNTSKLYGGDGDDILNGSNGLDELYGGDGLDQLLGGGGADRFIFEADSAFNDVDVIRDFNENEGDVLDIADILSGMGVNAGNISDYVDINFSGDDSYYDYVMALDPLVYYRLDESAGSVATDAMGRIDGAYRGSVTLGQNGFNGGISNDAAFLDGSNNEVVEIADSSLFDTTEGTVTAWFNASNLSSNRAVFSKDGSGNVDGQFYLGVDTNGDIYGRFQHSGVDHHVTFDPTAAVGGKVQTGQWYMLTLTYGSGGADVYLNGQLLGSSGTLVGTNSDRTFLIGAQNANNDPREEFAGSIDEVAWFGDELDAAGVANLYNAGITATDNSGPGNGVYVDVTGTGTFNAGNQIATLDDLRYISDELTMLNNGNLVI